MQKPLKLSKHAHQRLMERGIRTAEIEKVVWYGEVIARYEDDLPFPSVLMYKEVGGKFLHAVVADAGEVLILISAYVPNENEWENPPIRRKK